MSPTGFEKPGEDEMARSLVGAGTGPFQFISWDSNETIVLERNPHYNHGSWFNNQGPSYVDRIEWYLVPEAATRLSGLFSGLYDLFGGTEALPPDKVGLVEQRGGDAATVSQLEGPCPIALNAGREPNSNKRVRQALTHTVDIDKVRAFVTDGRGQAAYVPITKHSGPLYNPRAEDLSYGYDPATAKCLLAEAG